MDRDRVIASVIRGFWAFVFPLLGAFVAYLAVPKNVESIGVTNAVLIAAVSGFAYALKKLFFPDTRF